MPAPSEITSAQLLRLIGTPDCPSILDVRTDEDFEEDPLMIPGSSRCPHDDLSWITKGPVIVTCQKGLKLSQGAVAWLQSDGIRAEYLSGGMFAWRETKGAPRVPVAETDLWVTRHRPKIDRIACPWLIRRFVNPKARFLFVAPSAVAGVADRFGAIPFDVEDVHWSHRGDLCTFDVMLDEFGLRTETLDRLATVIRAADTNRHDLAPEAAGLLALSVGLSRQYKDDQTQLDRGMLLYDALYRWARDGFDELHDWPTGTA